MTDTRPPGVFVSSSARRAIIFANGLLANPASAHAAVQPTDQLIAADGGLHHLQALGLRPHVLIGDLDSIGPDEARRRAAGTLLAAQGPDRPGAGGAAGRGRGRRRYPDLWRAGRPLGPHPGQPA